jgi:acetoin utilization deacetylase AcuC-like enzyme
MEITPKKYKVGVAIDPIFQNHLTPKGFPESPARIGALLQALQNFVRIPLRRATREELSLCHDPAYIALVERECAEGRTTLSTGDVYLSQESFEVAL